MGKPPTTKQVDSAGRIKSADDDMSATEKKEADDMRQLGNDIQDETKLKVRDNALHQKAEEIKSRASGMLVPSPLLGLLFASSPSAPTGLVSRSGAQVLRCGSSDR